MRGVTKAFGNVIALDRVDLDVPAGQVHGVIGPNGAGKTTLLGLVLGLSLPDAGTLEILGESVHRRFAFPAGVAGFLDAPGLYPSLTARQNLVALARLRGVQQSHVGEALEQVGLADVGDDRVRGFSLGMRQRLGLAAALLARPQLLVLDEPTNGLDPAGARHVHDVLADLARAGTAVVLSSHRMDELAVMCSEVTILRTGRIVFTGPIGKLAAELGPMDYRLRSSDPARSRAIAASSPGLQLRESCRSTPDDEATVVVSGAVPALEDLVARLVGAGVAVRELAPVIPPLEAAFLALTAVDDAPQGAA